VPPRNPAALARAMVEMAQMSLTDKRLVLDKMRRRGREHVIKNFNWDRAAERYIKVYQNRQPLSCPLSVIQSPIKENPSERKGQHGQGGLEVCRAKLKKEKGCDCVADFTQEPLTGEWVIVATERARRPETFAPAKRKREPPCWRGWRVVLFVPAMNI